MGGMLTVILVWIAALYHRVHEPWPILERISSVPMIIYGYTTIAIALSIVVLARGRSLAAWHYATSKASGIETDTAHDRLAWGAKYRRLSAIRPRTGRKAPLRTHVGTMLACCYGQIVRRDALISTWMRNVAGDPSDKSNSIWSLLSRFRQRCSGWARTLRIATRVVVAFLLSMVFFGRVTEEQPLVSYWHEEIRTLNYLLGAAVYVAVFYCADTVNLWKAVVRSLGHYDVINWKSSESGMPRNALVFRVRQSMDTLVRCTEFVEPVIVMPLVLMTMLVLARSTVFEGWNWTGELIAFHVMFVGYIFGSAFLFQRQASRARDELLDRLDRERFRVSSEERIEVEMEIERIRNSREGAFVPWVQHPVLQSLAVPVGGVTIIALLEAWLLP